MSKIIDLVIDSSSFWGFGADPKTGFPYLFLYESAFRGLPASTEVKVNSKFRIQIEDNPKLNGIYFILSLGEFGKIIRLEWDEHQDPKPKRHKAVEATKREHSA